MSSTITQKNTIETLRKYILADGFPIVFDVERSQGAHFYNAFDDKRYLDCFSFFASLPIGYNHPKLKDPKYQEKLLRAAQVKVANSDVYTVEFAEFVETFAKVAGRPHFTHYFFIDGGTLAVENALKTAFDWKVRKNMAAGRGEDKGTKVIYFKDAFHGRSGYSMTCTNTFDPNKTKYFPKFDWIRIDNPYIAQGDTPQTLAEKEKKTFDQIHSAIQKNAHDIAALIIEPIQAEGGDHHFRGEFLQGLRKICTENEILLVFDEVQTGIGLTGKMWAHEHFNMVPDIVCFGKKTQICGIMATSRIDDVDSVFKVSSRINSTWGGNLVDMVRSRKFLEIIDEEKLVENAARMGAYFIEKIQSLAQKHNAITNIRGRGLFIAFDLPSTEQRKKFIDTIKANGGLVLSSGSRSVRLRPVLDFKKENVDEAIGLFEKTLGLMGL